ncbi:MAG TPA: DNA polymerase/3'-5' exonuclease PolX [Syntrophomonas wolfei]|uniref:DNA-directed DNA polymerase n=1 Tax=Syntrophomonas wolfei TaxID=863 RepID=A0A354YXV3_9FIRM|nr:DNA polymerase/3'-5' exonuclease PolX [Syntrophomonas wolfei]
MKNREVATVLVKIADLLQIKGDKPYKIRAYRKAAESIYHLDEDIAIIYEKGRVREVPGIGDAVAAKIGEILTTGSCEYYDRLSKEIPVGLLDMLAIPGLGHKSVKLIYDNLGIDKLDDLLQACQRGEIRNVPGLGVRSENNIIKGIAEIKQRSNKTELGIALPVARDFLFYLLQSQAITKAAIVGSIRRGKEMVSDIDILLASNDNAALYDFIKDFPAIRQIEQVDHDLIRGELAPGIEFEVIIVAPSDYFHSLAWTTGSKEHRERLFAGIDRQEFKDLQNETEVYTRLGLDYIAPELRENRGEIEAAGAGNLPKLINFPDIRGDLHVHSNWSDGVERIQDLAAAARSLDYEYIAITDHSKSLTISGGLSDERLQAQGKVIDALNAEATGGFRILKGTEVDILKTGELDFPDPVLKELDIVVASVHSNFKLDADQQTERIVEAAKNEHVDIIGHLTGRLLSRRSGYEIDVDKIIDTCARCHTGLEINAHPDRLDIDEHIARKAKEYGVKVAINSDAHHRNELKLMAYGVTTARRGWLEPGDVLNTLSLEKLLKALGKAPD